MNKNCLKLIFDKGEDKGYMTLDDFTANPNNLLIQKH